MRSAPGVARPNASGAALRVGVWRVPMAEHGAGSRRAISAVEVVLGAVVVIGHNVFGALPNEVPTLCAAALVSVRLRGGGWVALGFARPGSWRKAIAVAALAAALRIVLGDFVIDPLTQRFWPPAAAPAIADDLAGNAGQALLLLGLVWTFAAFGEEIGYRGYLLNRAAHVFGGSIRASWAAVVASAVLFGFGHFYKGPSGIVDSSVAGLILGGAYVLAGRNLWVPVLAHGFIDTVGVVLGYFGLDG